STPGTSLPGWTGGPSRSSPSELTNRSRSTRRCSPSRQPGLRRWSNRRSARSSSRT
ncbi:uncharacterized protein METZ01_LOCUS430260, partial [marine metagenome]